MTQVVIKNKLTNLFLTYLSRYFFSKLLELNMKFVNY